MNPSSNWRQNAHVVIIGINQYQDQKIRNLEFACADAEIDDLRATGISMDEIQRFFGWIESKKMMFFIDSCYSGEAGGVPFRTRSIKAGIYSLPSFWKTSPAKAGW